MSTNQCFVYYTRSVNKKNIKAIADLIKDLQGKLDFYILTYNQIDIDPIDEEYSDLKSIVVSVDMANVISKFHHCYHSKVPSSEHFVFMPGNIDLPQIYFLKKKPNYDFYWFCEDDVKYTGNFSNLIEKFTDVQSDLLATNCRKVPANWPHQDSLVVPDQFKLSVFDEICFFPFFRISSKAFLTIDKAYKLGWAGHHEIAWPSILNSHNLSISDFNSECPDLYSSNSTSLDLDFGTFTYMPPKLYAGPWRNKLYHPVKPLDIFLKNYRKYLRNRVSKVINKSCS